MTGPTQPASVVVGRSGRWLGATLLIHFAVVCAVKVQIGAGEEIWWLSHVSLMMAGLGLLTRSTLLVSTALTTVFVPHAFWLFDYAFWALFGVFPLQLTCYMAQANLHAWIATAHHFYLLPLLVLVVLRHRTYPPGTFPAAITLYLALTLVSRMTLSPASNVNWAFGAFTGMDHPLMNWFNRLPGTVYLLGLNACACGMMLVPAMLMRHHAAAKPRQ